MKALSTRKKREPLRRVRALPAPRLVALGLLLVPALATGCKTTFGARQRLAVGVEIVSNTTDGSARRECRIQHEAEAGKKDEVWLAFGRVRPQGERGWESIVASTRCGDGSFDTASAHLSPEASAPYVIVEIEAIPTVTSPGTVDVLSTLRIRKLTGFDEKGAPVYARSEQRRRSALETGDDAIYPLLVADPQEKDAFSVNELFLRLNVRVLGRERATYGTVSVTADVPGLDLLLDGGLVGRTLGGRPSTVDNVLAGTREVQVRDLSGRTVGTEVVVEKGRTIAVTLDLLKLPPSPGALVSIGKNHQGYDEYWRPLDGAMVVKVPAGEFLMGSAAGQGEPSERPQRQVYVTEFLMDKTQVTWRQFRKFAEVTGARLPPAALWGTADDYAVSNVTWDEAKTYCEWVGGRLPTEAEWEKASRGTDGRKYVWGDAWDQYACNSIEGGPHRPVPVGSFPKCLSPYGLVDMTGSVWQWCADWYAEGYPEGPARDPKGPATGTLRVLRGGAWIDQARVGVAYRYRNVPTDRRVHWGFRCVQSAPPNERTEDASR